MSVLGGAVLAGLVAIAVTVAIERWGGIVGGLLGTMPTTIVPAAWGIWANSSDPAGFAAAMASVPAGMLVNAVFLFLWRVVPPRLPLQGTARLVATLVVNLACWGLVASGFWLVLEVLPRLWVLPAGIALALVALVGGIFVCLQMPAAPRGRFRVGPMTLLGRALLAGLAVGFAIWLASRGAGLAAGLASVFPAIFVTTMVSLWLSQGEDVPVGAVGPMMLGSVSVSGFALVSTWAFPVLGVAVGTLVAWVVAVGAITAPSLAWNRRRALG